MRYLVSFILLFGCVLSYAQPVNDLKENALEVPHTSLWRSADAAYARAGATPDGPSNPTYGGPWYNVWFKFQATAEEVEFRVVSGGSQGTITRPVLTLVDADGEVLSSNETTYVRSIYLSPGDWYYVSVDSWESSTGTFTLEIVDHINFDMAAKAEVIPHTAQWASADAAYDNSTATGSTFDDVPHYNSQHNVWFKFKATTSDVDIRLLTGGSKGTLSAEYMILWDNEGNQISGKSNIYLQNVHLTPGQWYYLSVDGDSGMKGTFSLQVSNKVGFDNAEKAEVLNHVAFWQSADAQYTNVNTTGAQFNGDPWGGYHNVWFTFTATTTDLDFRIVIGGAKGTFVGPVVKLWDATGTQISDQRSDYLQSVKLVPGQKYYISVDTFGDAGMGTFAVSISNKMGFDMRARAETLTSLSSWTSADAAYTLVGATGDSFDDNQWGGFHNVWFKFKAVTTDITIDVLYGGTKGTLTNASTKLYDAFGAIQPVEGYTIKTVSLIPGATYYFSVDTNGNDPGSFSLKISDHIGYDMKGGAEVIQHAAGWCTDNAYYSTIGATPDQTNSSTCGAFHNNVWFKFQATGPTITVKLSTGGDKGTLTYPALYLLDNAGAALACHTNTGAETAEVTYTSLTKGQWYYLVADSYSGGMGTFTLCVDGGSGSELNSFCKDIFCDGKGGLGINTSIIPEGFKLSVRGKVIAEGVKVEVQAKWPDYVFDMNYVLPDLSEVKQYIEKNHHLPGVPSAREVQQSGIDLGNMDAVLLKKIEELTLHLIEMEERLKAVETENRLLRDSKR